MGDGEGKRLALLKFYSQCNFPRPYPLPLRVTGVTVTTGIGKETRQPPHPPPPLSQAFKMLCGTNTKFQVPYSILIHKIKDISSGLII